MYYLATKSIIKLLYDRNDLLRYAIVFQNFPQYLMVYTVEGFFKTYKIHAERSLPFDYLLYKGWVSKTVYKEPSLRAYNGHYKPDWKILTSQTIYVCYLIVTKICNTRPPILKK
jgi:hypothetical protein